MTNVTIIFDNKKQADTFLSWFFNSGEQDYFNQDEYLEEDEELAKGFTYDYKELLITAK